VREGAVTYPADDPTKPGNEIIFTTGFPTQSGRGKIVPAKVIPPDELPDTEYPMVLSTGRVLEHWHTGSMTRRANVLDAIEPEAVAFMSPKDMRKLNVWPGDLIRLPMNQPHGIFNKSDQTVKCFFWVSPTRRLYDLFWAIHSMKDQNPPDVVALSAKHEVMFLPPPPGA